MTKNNQSGQTLIETIVAIFILTTALTAGLGLAIYAMSVGSTAQNQIVAASLAREGVEVVRMMRDSIWLASDIKGGQWDLVPCADVANKMCYPRPYDSVPGYIDYDLNAGSYNNFVAQNYRLNINTAGGVINWSLDTNTNTSDLYLQANGTYSHVVNGSPIYNRQVKIEFNTAAPFTASNPELIVKSIVAWRGKNCTAIPQGANLDALVTPCKIHVEERLTNWKDYK